MIGKRWKMNLAIALLFAVGAVLSNCSISDRSAGTVTVAAGEESAPGRDGDLVGNPAPDFQLARIDGGQISLDDLRGRPAVIVFWTSWCPICREEAPRINALAAEYESKGVRVLGINVKDSVARAESGVKEFGVKYVVARDPDGNVARAYKVTGAPTIVFLDRKGVVRYFSNDLPDDYARRLDELLAENI